MTRTAMSVVADTRSGVTRYYVDNLEITGAVGTPVPEPTGQGSIPISDATPQWIELTHPGSAHRHLETDGTTLAWVADLNLDDDAYLYLGAAQNGAVRYVAASDHVEVTGAAWHIITPDLGVGREPISRFGVSSPRNALTDLSDPANFHVVLDNPDNDTGEGVGLGWYISGENNDVGAALVFVRTDSHSMGELRVYTKQSNADVTPPALVATFQDDGMTRFYGNVGVGIAPAAAYGVYSVTAGATAGMYGVETSGIGVHGQATSGEGVRAESATGTALNAYLTGASGNVATLTSTAGASWTFDRVGDLTIKDGGAIKVASGPTLVLDGTNNYFELTGGSVGIGTATPDTIFDIESSDPEVRLTNSDAYNVANYCLVDFRLNSDSTERPFGQIKVTSTTVTPDASRYGRMDFVVAGAGAFGTPIMSIWGGAVGIRTTTPQQALHILGLDGAVTSPTIGTRDFLVLENDNNANIAIISGSSSVSGIKWIPPSSSFQGAIFYDHSDDQLEFYVGGAEVATLDDGGNLDISGAVERFGWFCGYAAEQTAFDGTLTDIDIDTEIRKDTDYYTHSAGSDNITITETGWYRISYCVLVRGEQANRQCVRVWVYDDGVVIPHSGSQCYVRQSTYGRYESCSNSFIVEVGAGSVIDLRTDGQYTTGAFGAGTCDYDILAGSQITIERVDE